MCVILCTENKYLEQIIFLAIEEDEVPYYTGRKKLADEKDATVDYEENKTLIKRYVFRNNSVVYLSLVFCFLFSVFPSMKWYLVIIRNDSESFK